MLEESEGIGVRVRVGGAWGFAAARGCERRDAEAALARALARTCPAADRRRSAYPGATGARRLGESAGAQPV